MSAILSQPQCARDIGVNLYCISCLSMTPTRSRLAVGPCIYILHIFIYTHYVVSPWKVYFYISNQLPVMIGHKKCLNSLFIWQNQIATLRWVIWWKWRCASVMNNIFFIWCGNLPLQKTDNLYIHLLIFWALFQYQNHLPWKDSHYEDKMAMRPFYLNNGNIYNHTMASYIYGLV